jgi:hypothetical protein
MSENMYLRVFKDEDEDEDEEKELCSLMIYSLKTDGNYEKIFYSKIFTNSDDNEMYKFTYDELLKVFDFNTILHYGSYLIKIDDGFYQLKELKEVNSKEMLFLRYSTIFN